MGKKCQACRGKPGLLECVEHTLLEVRWGGVNLGGVDFITQASVRVHCIVDQVRKCAAYITRCPNVQIRLTPQIGHGIAGNLLFTRQGINMFTVAQAGFD